MSTTRILVACIIAAGIWGMWAFTNQPQDEPAWPSVIRGISFSPMHHDSDPINKRWPTPAQIESDLAIVAGKVGSIRTYSVQGTQADIPALAMKYNLSVTVGAWLTDEIEENNQEIEKLIRVVNANPNVSRVIVGNEVVLRGQLSTKELIAYLDRVRTAVRVPVSTAEPWHVWVVNPELVKHVDFISAQLLPWWEGVPLDDAVDFVQARYMDIQRLFPDKKILISEVGWPSNGLKRISAFQWSEEEAQTIGRRLKGEPEASVEGDSDQTTEAAVTSEDGPTPYVDRPSFLTRLMAPATPSAANQGSFLRRFLARAEAEGFDYYVLEAFDQPWKASFEGSVGAHWGVYDADRKLKFPLSGPIVPIPQWRMLAGASVILAIAIFGVFLLDGETLNRKGTAFLGIMAVAVAPAGPWLVYDYTRHYLTPMSTIIGLLLGLGFAMSALLLMVEAHEWAEASWISRRRRQFGALRVPEHTLPKVSIHVPAYSEPADMMINTLDSLARLDYPNYEVLVIDNNTEDPALWLPVRSRCEQLGERFRFFHIDKLAGFKAGALNFALRHTADDAEIIAVIDSDYQVRPEWLKDMIPHFQRPETAIVQGPQDYVDEPDNAFKRMCYSEYKGFFQLGMVTRNERNAIIQHGTMTMVRRSVLTDVGAWAEWCITEDSELGLRVFEQGYEAVYVKDSYGKGILPDRFIDYKKQRFRWAYGAVMILRGHLGRLLRREPSRLTPGQIYHFIAGWLPWLADGLNLIWTIAAVVYSFGMILFPRYFGPPPALLIIAAIFSFGFRVMKTGYLYRKVMGVSRKETLGAVMAGMSLCHTVGRAVLTGFVTTGQPFFRTPKCEDKPQVYQAIAAASEETALAAALWIMAFGVGITQGLEFPVAMLWCFALLVQSLPYVASVVFSLINMAPVDAPVLGNVSEWLSNLGRVVVRSSAAKSYKD
ncbi:MAG: glycosyltransferase [Pseudomonadota bacterium]